MKYEKPKLIKTNGLIPPVTVNFAQPATQTGEKNVLKRIK